MQIAQPGGGPGHYVFRNEGTKTSVNWQVGDVSHFYNLPFDLVY